MKEYLGQLDWLVESLGGAVMLYAGDLFDDGWRARRVPPKLINFLVEHMPRGYAIPGQHDLPHHRYEAIKESAYWTLVETKTIKNLAPGVATKVGKVWVTGFPWGTPPVPDTDKTAHALPHIALIHKYVWMAGCCHHNVRAEEAAAAYLHSLDGYNVAAFGDNHLGFSKRFIRKNTTAYRSPNLTVFNCGHFIRRNSDEKEYKPRVGVVHSDGSVTTVYLNTVNDLWADQPYNNDWEHFDHNNNGYAEAVKHLAEVGVDFVDALRRVAAKAPHHVRAEVTNILDSLQ